MSVTISFSIDKKLAEKFKELIDKEEKNASKVVTNLIQNYINNYGKIKNN